MRFGRLIAVLMVLLTAAPALGQQSRREDWVATWATALVSRAQPGARGQGPGGAAAAGAPAAAAPLTPFEGAPYFTPEGETKRQALNEWIRTGGMYDGVIDFDRITRDPAAPTRFLPAYDSGDHLHSGDAG